MVIDLNKDTFLLFAAKCYDPYKCILEEFESDLKRIRYIKRLFQKYRLGGELKERLILNHLIVLGNVFGVDNTVRMLFYKIAKNDYDSLKTFLIYLNFLPKSDWILGINGGDIRISDIPINTNIAEVLRKV